MHDNEELRSSPLYSAIKSDLDTLSTHIKNISQDQEAIAKIEERSQQQIVQGYRDIVESKMESLNLSKDISNLDVQALEKRSQALEQVKGSLNSSDEGYSEQLKYINELLEQTAQRRKDLILGKAEVGDEVNFDGVKESADSTVSSVDNLSSSISGVGSSSSDAVEDAVYNFGNLSESLEKAEQLVGSSLKESGNVDFTEAIGGLYQLYDVCGEVVKSSEEMNYALEGNGSVAEFHQIEQIQNFNSEMETTKEKLAEIVSNSDLDGLMQTFGGLSNIIASECQRGRTEILALQLDMNRLNNLSYDSCKAQFETLDKKINSVNSAMSELQNNGKLGASTLTSLFGEVPEIMDKIGKNGEVSLQTLIDMQNELAETSRQTYIDMLGCSEEYYKQVVLGDQEKKAILENQMNELLKAYGINYQIDLGNYNTMNEAKATLEGKLMDSLSKAWSQHIKELADKLINLLGGFSKGMSGVATSIGNSFAKGGLSGALSGALGTAGSLVGMATDAIKDFVSSIKGIGGKFDDVVNTLKNIDTTFAPVNVDYNRGSGGYNGGYNPSKDRSPSSSRGSKSSKDKDNSRELEEKAKAQYQYIASIYDSMIQDIMDKGKKVENAISATQSKIEYATMLGMTSLRDNSVKESINLRKKLIEETGKMQNELNKVINQMRKDLQGTKLFSAKELDNLDHETLAKKIQALNKQIADADKANDYDKQYRLEKQKALLEDIGERYLQALEESQDLEDTMWKRKMEHLQAYAEGIKQVYDDIKQAQDRAISDIDLQLSTMITDSSLQGNKQAMSEFEASIMLRAKKIDFILAKEKAVQAEIKALRDKGFQEESAEIQALIQEWKTYEQARLGAIKEIAEARRQAEFDSRNYELDEINYHKDYIQNLLDMTVDMLKQEIEDKKDALEEEYNNTKEAKKKEYELEKEALEKKLSLIKEEAEKRKKALKRDKEERTYKQELEEKQKEVAKLKALLDELSLDTSLAGKKKYKEIYEEYIEAVKDLDNLQYDHSVEMQENAIDDQTDLLEQQIKDEKEALEKKYKEEEKMRKEAYEKEKKELEKLLKKKGELYAQANELIRQDEQALYEKLKVYASEYTNTTQAEFEDLWNKAYEGLDRYGSKSESVMDILNRMTEQAIRLKDELRDLNNTSYKDFIDDDDSDLDFSDDYKPTKPDTSSDADDALNEKRKYIVSVMDEIIRLGDSLSGASGSEKKQIMAQMDSLGASIHAYKQKDQWYYIVDGVKLPIREARKKMASMIRHTGLETGEVGASKGKFKLKANEELNKLQKGEIVLTPKQSENIVENAKKLAGNVKKGIEQGINLVLDMHDFNVTKESLNDFQKMLKTEVPKIIQNTLTNRGIKR